VQEGPARSAEEVWQRALDLRPGLLSRAERERPSVGSARTRSAARRSPLFTAYEGRLSRAPANGPLDRQVSASRLELFAGCPYRLFLEKVLGLAEVKRPRRPSEADNLAKGNLLHDALASLVRSVPKGRSLTRLADPAHLRRSTRGRRPPAGPSGPARPGRRSSWSSRPARSRGRCMRCWTTSPRGRIPSGSRLRARRSASGPPFRPTTLKRNRRFRRTRRSSSRASRSADAWTGWTSTRAAPGASRGWSTTNGAAT
jgi:hypothetical protein